MTPQQEARLVELQRKKDTTPAEMKELQRLQADMDRALDRGARAAESGKTGTRGAMPMVLGKKRGGMIMKKRFEDGGDVDYDKDSDVEAQRVYRADLSEVGSEERSPKAAPKAAAKAKRSSSAPAKSERVGGAKSLLGPSVRNRVQDIGKIKFKSGGSVGSASRRADGIAMRGKTKGRII